MFKHFEVLAEQSLPELGHRRKQRREKRIKGKRSSLRKKQEDEKKRKENQDLQDYGSSGLRIKDQGYLCIPAAACLAKMSVHLSASNLAAGWHCCVTITNPHKDD